MNMAKSASPPPGDNEKKIADANWLMGENPRAAPKSRPRAAPPPAGRPVDDDHSYDLAGGDNDLFTTAEPEAPPSPIPVPAPPSASPKPPRPTKPKDEWDVTDAPAAEYRDEDESAVDQVWSRSAEWGTHLFWVGLAAAAVVFAVYKALTATQFLLAFLILAGGGAAVLALCYPIFITLERPVRITPEQAAKDYYAMLSYPFPFFPRMWLLLSNTGRHAPEFSSYGQFKSYWKRKLASIQGGKASFINPLRFRVENFTSGKSAGQTSLSAKYTLKVFRGEPKAGSKELASYLVSTGLVKGPDRMWYLSSGTLPNERRERAEKGGPAEDDWSR
jgi:hypothetical protein